MKKWLSAAIGTSNFVTKSLDYVSPVFALGIRYYLAHIFLWSGYLKIQSWESTLFLFENEYQVPIISSVLAAYIGTTAELILPSFLLLGLGARFPAIALFIFNIVMFVSYPPLLTSSGECMAKDNYLWAVLTLILVFYGHGKLSLDYLLQKKACPNYRY